MSNKYAGTKTEQNLWTAFAGESQARNKYTYFASVAKKEGYEQISALFLKTADNEKEHAKLWFKELGELGDTVNNKLNTMDQNILDYKADILNIAKNEDTSYWKYLHLFREVSCGAYQNLVKSRGL